jgi:hypothetical protein
MNHNQQQRVWEALLAVHSLDELDGDLRLEADSLLSDSLLSDSADFAEAWQRLQQFNRELRDCLLASAATPATQQNIAPAGESDGELSAGRLLDLTSRVSVALKQAARQHEFDAVHDESDLESLVGDESRELWTAAREFDVAISQELANVEVPAGLQGRLLANLANAESADAAQPDDTASDLVSPARPESRSQRRRWLLIGASVVAASVIGMIYIAQLPTVGDLSTLETLVAQSVQVLGREGELAWATNTERMQWAMPEKAAGKVGDSEATFFRLQQPGQDVYLVRVTHELAQEVQLRLPFRDVPASGGWHVGAWSDGTHLFFACSRDRDSLELFREHIHAI